MEFIRGFVTAGPGMFEAEHLAALRIDTRHHVDVAIFSGRIHPSTPTLRFFHVVKDDLALLLISPERPNRK
jgi:hypothetical protein